MSVGWITLILALFVAAMTLAAALGRLPANGTIGIRTSATQRSDAAWIAGHRAAANLVVPASVVAAALGVAVGTGWNLGPLSVGSTGGTVLIAYVVVLVIAAVIANQAARNLPVR